MKLHLTVVFCTALLVAGCSTPGTAYVRVSSERSDDASRGVEGRSFVLIEGRRVETELPFFRISQPLNAALTRQGYRSASTAAEADLVLIATYGTGSLRDAAFEKGLTARGVSADGPIVVGRAIPDLEQGSIYASRKQIAQSHDLEHFIVLQAFAAEDIRSRAKKPRLLWTTRTSTAAMRTDLTAAVPALIQAAEPALGMKTSETTVPVALVPAP